MTMAGLPREVPSTVVTRGASARVPSLTRRMRMPPPPASLHAKYKLPAARVVCEGHGVVRTIVFKYDLIGTAPNLTVGTIGPSQVPFPSPVPVHAT